MATTSYRNLLLNISITNLAERHLRLRHDGVPRDPRGSDINHESSRKAFETPSPLHLLPLRRQRISITNLAERHLRPANREVDARAGRRISITNLAERHLRHECSLGSPSTSTVSISITNLAERHLRPILTLPSYGHKGKISITNLAERHLRQVEGSKRARRADRGNINHESSRKAFETCC